MTLRTCVQIALTRASTDQELRPMIIACINNSRPPPSYTMAINNPSSIMRQDTELYEPHSPIGPPPANLFSEEVSTTSYPQDITGGKKSRRHRQHNYRKTRRHHRKIRSTRRH